VTSLDPRQLECFIAVAEELNLSRAAIRLHVSQPPLTRRIKRLELDVGAELFTRTPTGMRLTEAGHALLEPAYRIVALSNQAVDVTRKAHPGELGHLTIGYYDSAILDGIPALLRVFASQHPGVSLSFERVLKQTQLHQVRDGILHVAFGRNYPPLAGLVSRPVDVERLYLAVGTATAAELPETVRVCDLRSLPLALYPTARPEFADEVVHMCMAAGFAPNVAIQGHDVVSTLALVSIGNVAAVVPRSATKTRTDDVVFIPISDAPTTTLSCLYLEHEQTPSLRLLVRLLDDLDARARVVEDDEARLDPATGIPPLARGRWSVA
jgi:DNA-binding transcriptional LysR family regulator